MAGVTVVNQDCFAHVKRVQQFGRYRRGVAIMRRSFLKARRSLIAAAAITAIGATGAQAANIT